MLLSIGKIQLDPSKLQLRQFDRDPPRYIDLKTLPVSILATGDDQSGFYLDQRTRDLHPEIIGVMIDPVMLWCDAEISLNDPRISKELISGKFESSDEDWTCKITIYRPPGTSHRGRKQRQEVLISLRVQSIRMLNELGKRLREGTFWVKSSRIQQPSRPQRGRRRGRHKDRQRKVDSIRREVNQVY